MSWQPSALLAGGRAVVTGGANGIGRAVCLALAGHGARVLAVDVDEHGLEVTVGSAQRTEIVKPMRTRANRAGKHIISTALSFDDGRIGIQAFSGRSGRSGMTTRSYCSSFHSLPIFCN